MLKASLSADIEQLRKSLLLKLDERTLQQDNAHAIRALLEKLIAQANDTKIQQDLLASLQYEGMGARKDNISKTYGNTYEWVFDPGEDQAQVAHLHEWLRAGEGVFWVSGKPGSGKSTLMKFIQEHCQTTRLLQEWAGEDSLVVTASFFFWINGNPMQRSQEGLLREMCASILKQCPNIFLDLWSQVEGIPKDLVRTHAPQAKWPTSTLRSMFERLQNASLEHHGRTVRFAFFVDGLDEYSGDHEDLVEILTSLGSSANVKLCVASRPWNIFEQAFGNDEHRKLYMQRLTHNDIATYVEEKIGNHQHFVHLLREDERAQDIIDDIISRAAGVFLWVYLVERQIRRSLVNRDNLQTLRKRVLQMPTDLNVFFKQMFDNLVSSCKFVFKGHCVSQDRAELPP